MILVVITLVKLLFSAVQPQKYPLKVFIERRHSKYHKLQLPLVVRQRLTELVVMPVDALDLLLTVSDF